MPRARTAPAGARYASLTLLGEPGTMHRITAPARCDCGRERTVYLSPVLRGEQLTCGCGQGKGSGGYHPPAEGKLPAFRRVPCGCAAPRRCVRCQGSGYVLTRTQGAKP
jgi:hypothetical protein